MPSSDLKFLGLLSLVFFGYYVFFGDAESELESVSLRWYAPILSPGGYSSEALTFGLAFQEHLADLHSFGLIHHGDTASEKHVQNNLHGKERALLNDVLIRYDVPDDSAIDMRVNVCHSEPGAWHAPTPRYHTQRCPPPKSPSVRTLNVGRTMFETDSIPDGWVSRLNFMDEVWVPTAFQEEIMVLAGVAPEKLRVVPEPVETSFYRPYDDEDDEDEREDEVPPPAVWKVERSLLQSLRQYRRKGFTLFLFVGKWEERKGVRSLLRSFYQEFGVKERALLLVLTSAYHSSSDFDRQIDTILREEGLLDNDENGEGDAVKKRRKILLLNDLSQYAMPRLYSLASALVIPSKGEGWGRPHVESMSCGTPVIATNWSGPTAYLTEANSFPITVKRLVSAETSGWNSHKWAEPSESHLRSLMRQVHENEDGIVERKGRQAREDMARFSLETIAGVVHAELGRLASIGKESDDDNVHGEL